MVRAAGTAKTRGEVIEGATGIAVTASTRFGLPASADLFLFRRETGRQAGAPGEVEQSPRCSFRSG